MWPNTQFFADLVTFTEEILNEKLYFLCGESFIIDVWQGLNYDAEWIINKRKTFTK